MSLSDSSANSSSIDHHRQNNNGERRGGGDLSRQIQMKDYFAGEEVRVPIQRSNPQNNHHRNFHPGYAQYRQFPTPPSRTNCAPKPPPEMTPPRIVAQQKLLIERLSNLSRISSNMDLGYQTLLTQNSSLTQIPTTLIPPGIPFVSMAKSTFHHSGPYFNMLNDDLMLKIFSWLDTLELMNAAQVCKRFESLCWSPKVWRSVHLKGEHIYGDKMLKHLFKRLLAGQMKNPSLNFIERIYISNNCKVTDKGLGALSRRCPELTHLQVQFCGQVSNSGISEVVTKCTNLQHLDITGKK